MLSAKKTFVPEWGISNPVGMLIPTLPIPRYACIVAGSSSSCSRDIEVTTDLDWRGELQSLARGACLRWPELDTISSLHLEFALQKERWKRRTWGELNSREANVPINSKRKHLLRGLPQRTTDLKLGQSQLWRNPPTSLRGSLRKFLLLVRQTA